jgi:uncharacterized membrane protein YgdD (TMEM256/DUF423 family)
MSSTWIATGALLAALSVTAGAFGAHALATRLDARGLELWETGARYLMFSGLGLVLIGLFDRSGGAALTNWAGAGLLAGAVVFWGTLAAMALGAPRWLGAITPIGGALMIAGFVLFAVAALRS